MVLGLDMHRDFEIRMQLFRERLSEKNVHATIPKADNMGHDQHTVPDTVAGKPTFVALL